MNILCRLGLHSWKPVFRREEGFEVRPGTLGEYLAYLPGTRFTSWFECVGKKCRRCGKRVRL